MRGQFAAAIRVFMSAYVGAVVWVLAGCGWGVVIGSALEAAFGRGTHGLLDAAGETSLEATAGALAGMAGGALLTTLLLVGAMVPLAALLDKRDGLHTRGNGGLGLRQEGSTRLGALLGLVCGLSTGTALGSLVGAASLLDSIQGRPFSCAFVQRGTRLGIFVGGIVGAVVLVRTIYRQIPKAWQEALPRGSLYSALCAFQAASPFRRGMSR
jgi:hypothetical protein